MPTALRVGPYRFFFYASDGQEPRHVHIERDNRVAKFWLDPVEIQSDGGLRASEIRRIARIVEDNQRVLMETWDDFFGE